MSKSDSHSEECTDTVPAGAALIGIDAEGARHYLGNRITHDGVPVYVDAGDTVETFDLAETPCITQDDAVEAWLDHVERKRGPWTTVVYNQPLGAMLATALEQQAGGA